jgi:hypothetical protein
MFRGSLWVVLNAEGKKAIFALFANRVAMVKGL